jgi:hypothetical protein
MVLAANGTSRYLEPNTVQAFNCGMRCPEYNWLQQHYEAALRHWGYLYSPMQTLWEHQPVRLLSLR